jgi:hypothetical protein
MSQKNRRNSWSRKAGVLALSLVASLSAGGQQQPAPPKPTDAAGALPAHDLHQGLLIAADPVLTSDRSQQIFGKKHPYHAGILALDVYLRNDSDGPMKVELSTFELKVAPPGQSRQRIEPLTAEETAYRIILPDGPDPRPKRSPIPGMGGPSKKSKEVAKMEDSLRGQMLSGDVVGPHGTIHGFVFFDVGGHFGSMKSATLVVPDVSRIPSGEKLFFFEVDLGPATL